MRYLDFKEYVYLGGVIDETAFNRNIDRACAVVDRATFRRVERMTEVPNRVKTLCRDLVEYLNTNGNVSEKNVTSRSESVGNVSESVSYNTKTDNEMQRDIQNMLFDYLYMLYDDNGTPLLYLGGKK